MAATAKVFQLPKAPKRIHLFGDKVKKPESQEHIIEFPGGAIAVCRTSKNQYWAHILVNRKEVIEDADGLSSRLGRIVESRFDDGLTIRDLPCGHNVSQVAVLIETDASSPADDVITIS